MNLAEEMNRIVERARVKRLEIDKINRVVDSTRGTIDELQKKLVEFREEQRALEAHLDEVDDEIRQKIMEAAAATPPRSHHLPPLSQPLSSSSTSSSSTATKRKFQYDLPTPATQTPPTQTGLDNDDEGNDDVLNPRRPIVVKSRTVGSSTTTTTTPPPPPPPPFKSTTSVKEWSAEAARVRLYEKIDDVDTSGNGFFPVSVMNALETKGTSISNFNSIPIVTVPNESFTCSLCARRMPGEIVKSQSYAARACNRYDQIELAQCTVHHFCTVCGPIINFYCDNACPGFVLDKRMCE